MPQTRLYNWLIMAFSEPLNNLMEALAIPAIISDYPNTVKKC